MSRIVPRRTNLRLLVNRPGLLARLYAGPLSVLLIGAAVDGFTTYRVVSALGAGAEVHPAQRLVLMIFGAGWGVLIAKLIQLGFVVVVACWWRPWCGWMLAVCGLLYGVAAVSNHCGWL